MGHPIVQRGVALMFVSFGSFWVYCVHDAKGDVMSTTTTLPAATITDEKGNETLLDRTAYRQVMAFLRAIGVAPKTNETADDVRLTTGQAAEMLETSPRTVARLIDSGKLPGSRMGTGYRTCMLSDVMEFRRASEERMHVGVERVRETVEEDGLDDELHADAVAAYLKSFS